MQGEVLNQLGLLDEDRLARITGDPKFDDLVQRVERVCSLMRLIQRDNEEILNDPDDPGPAPSPRSRPELHMAVENTWKAWLELTGGKMNKKKDFLQFAYLCLEPTKRVTPSAILESFDRHVRVSS